MTGRSREYWQNLPRTRPAEVEVPGPGQESVWDYPRPPRVEPCPLRLRVSLGGTVVAQSARAVRVVETSGAPVYYFPPRDVHGVYLRAPRDPGTSLCEWKGTAHYYDVCVGARRVPRGAWCYPEPDPDYRDLASWPAFFAGRGFDAWVGDERAQPQPGGFYGGWVTSKITGPIKGEPGSESW